MQITNLRTNNRKSPLVLDRGAVYFGWNMEAQESNVILEAYRIQVWDNERNKVWDSGLCTDSVMVNILYQGTELRAESRYTWRVKADISYGENNDNRYTKALLSEEAYFETGIFEEKNWLGEFIGETSDHIYNIYRKTFQCSDTIKKAKIYICGLGHFELYINGNRISDYVLEPGWSDYNKTSYYTAYDITEELSQGNNSALVKLGDGMFNVPGGRYVYYKRSYGKMKLLAKLVIDYEDGTTEVIVTDNSWKKRKSPINFCCIYGGEEFDGRLWKKELLQAEYEENNDWTPAEVVTPPVGKLKAQPMESIKVMEEYKPVSITETKPGVYLYDFGKNFSGWVRLRIRSNGKQSGQKIVLTPGEILDKNMVPDQSVTGRGYNWTYILNGERNQEFAPDFTYTGFRYVEVRGVAKINETNRIERDIASEENRRYTGRKIVNVNATSEYSMANNDTALVNGKASLDFCSEEFMKESDNEIVNMEYEKQSEIISVPEELPELLSLTGEFIYPELEEAGNFKCSNELFNQIHGIIRQAILSNTKSYFTDCPHREKLGWLEQTHLIGPSVMYNFDVLALYHKIEGDMHDAQRDDGLVPDICPEYVTEFAKWHEGFVDSPEWGSAFLINTWYVYKRFGDTALFTKYYEDMKKYINYLSSKTHHEVLHHGLGDWLDIGPMTPNSQNTPVPVIATCIYYYDLEIMKKIAEILEKAEDVKLFTGRMEKVYGEYNLQFLDRQTGRYATGSQAAQAMSLITGLVPEDIKDKVISQLRNDIVKRKYAVTAGDIGHPFLVAALMKFGMEDLLNEMLLITEHPGYGYQVVNGATTLTEEWDGPEPGRPHGSQNHFMLGNIEEWFFGSLGGIDLIRKDRELNELRIRPYIAKGIDWVDTWVKHPYGKVQVSWKREGREAVVKVVLPPNTHGFLEDENGEVVKEVGSGIYTYRFTYNKKELD
jgi:alpha-L-rhamnosidase